MPNTLEDAIAEIKAKGIITEFDHGEWDIDVDFPTFGIKGEEWKVKTDKKVKEINVKASNDLAFERPRTMSLGKTPKPELMFGSFIVDVTGEDVDEVKGEWKTGRNFNSKFQNLLLAGDYLFEVNIIGNEANEQVTVRAIIPVVEKKEDLKNVKIPEKPKKKSYEIPVEIKEDENPEDYVESTEEEDWY